VTYVFHVISLRFLLKNWFVHLVYAIHFPSLILLRSGRFPFCFWACLGERRSSSSYVAYTTCFLFMCLLFAISFVGVCEKGFSFSPEIERVAAMELALA
jgi:hypothetical protein